MAKLASLHAQRAIRTLLRNDAALTALTGAAQRVFDGVPDDQPYPYITFGDHSGEPWDAFGQDGQESRITMFVWSQARGYEEVLAIAERVNELLHQHQLVLTSGGLTTVSLRLEMMDTMREPDGRTRRAILRYHLFTQEPPS